MLLWSIIMPLCGPIPYLVRYPARHLKIWPSRKRLKVLKTDKHHTMEFSDHQAIRTNKGKMIRIFYNDFQTTNLTGEIEL